MIRVGLNFTPNSTQAYSIIKKARHLQVTNQSKFLFNNSAADSNSCKSNSSLRALIQHPRLEPISCTSNLPIEATESIWSSNNHKLYPYLGLENSTSKQKHLFQAKRNVQVRRKIFKKQLTPLDPKYNMEWPKILFFGDSITRRANDVEEGCWGSMIESQVNNYFDVDYRGFEGYNTRWALEMLPKLFPRSYLEKVEILVPFFGHNDSWDPKNPLSIPVDEYERNLCEIIEYFQDNGVDKSKIILITPTWFHQESFSEFMKSIGMPPSGKTFDDAEKYAAAVIRVAEDFDVEMLDMFKISSEFEPLNDLFSDGVHYSKKGAKLLFDQLFPIIKAKIEARFKKPLDDLRHAVPWDQRPEVLPALGQYIEVAKEKGMTS